MAQASDLLAAETAERHRRVVVICDESHLLQPDQLEELRLLTNAEMDSASPFAAILAGQPTLNRQLRMGTFAALDQRIATRFTIKPMDLAESAAYLRHHLKLAGRDEPLFADDAIARLHRVSNGLPRALNNAAVAALIAAAAAARTSSTTPAPRKPSPSSPGTDHAPARRPRSPAGRRAIPYEPRPRRPSRPPSHHRRNSRRGAALVARRLARQAAVHEHQALAQWDRLIASFHAQRAADQQAKLDALLLEAIAALAGLLARTTPATAQPDHRRQQKITAKTCRNVHTERCRLMCKQRGR